MNPIFIFDLEGTLARPSQPMDAGFARYLRAFMEDNTAYVVSGGTFGQIESQLPVEVLEACTGVFANNGAEFMAAGRLVYSKQHEFHPLLRVACETFVDTSWYPVRRGRHIEELPGMLVVSALGANANEFDRRRYRKWDETAGEREHLVRSINNSGLGYEARLCGDTSVEIAPRGWNKAVACDEIMRRHPGAPLRLYADHLSVGQADHCLVGALAAAGHRDGVCEVESYHDTWSRLVRLDRNNTRREGLNAA